MNDFLALENRLIIVFGASSGIGRQVSITLSEQGARLILVARGISGLKKTAELCNGNSTSFYQYDLSCIDGIDSLIEKIVKENGSLDGMVYSAGMNEDLPIKNVNYNKFLNTFNVNYFAFMECIRQTTKKNRYSSGYRIVGISSISSFLGEKAHVAYAGSKAAMDGSIRVIAKELAPKGICINTVAPGMIASQMTNDFIMDNGIESNAYQRTMQRQYLGMGEPLDVANAVCFLLSPASRLITGVSLPVDGGFSTSC